jgi:hypothetical protein
MASRRDVPRTTRSETVPAAESAPTVFPPGDAKRKATARRAPAGASTATAPAPMQPTPPRVAPTPEAATQARSGVGPTSPRVRVSNETRYQMIAEAAYLRAERRGFEPGREIEDWLAAEEEVNRVLAAATPQ